MTSHSANIVCHDDEFGTPMSKKWDLEQDLINSEFIRLKIKNRPEYRHHLYAALCNNEFQPIHVWPQLADYKWSCTWRYAGGIVADILDSGSYIDYYCTFDINHAEIIEGVVTDEVRDDLKRLGWIVITDN